MTNKLCKGAELLVAGLQAEGVERVFAVPGEENLDVLEALRTSSIQLIVTRHEQPAAFMAATYGRLTGRPGVCLTTLGPGATNLTTGAAFARLGAMPMLMITGQKPILSAPQAQFQMLDIVAMMRPLTKYAEAFGAHGARVEHTDALLPCLTRALDQGGVHVISVPVDYSENQRVLVDSLRALRP